MKRQLVRLKSNIGTIHVQFDWDNNIAIDSAGWINGESIEFCNESMQEMHGLLAYAIGEGETPEVGMRYDLICGVFSYGKSWTWLSLCENATELERVEATVTEVTFASIH